ncbi:MAG: hypothetical protein M1832_003053 [Thelocarpon impressellum]|nr:MAG: hypothetical protein M1832_003053 [Thelocarpon impressellum]
MFKLLPVSVLALSLFFLAPALSFPLKRNAASGTRAPPVAIDQDFADPAILNVSGTWFAYSTSAGLKNVQVATSENFADWTVTTEDALPTLPGWATGPGNVWAPQVIERGDGKYVMYFSARPVGSSQHCVGAGLSDWPQGPFVPQPEVLACPVDQGGAIDASGFNDGGTHFVLYKVDGNSLGHNAPTPIMLQRLGADAMIPDGPPTAVLEHDAGDGPLIEAPSLGKTAAGVYYLFFSSNLYDTPLYDISYAHATAIAGPYTKAKQPFQVTGDVAGIVAPGGADVSPCLENMVYHAFRNGKDIADGRAMYAVDLSDYQLEGPA